MNADERFDVAIFGAGIAGASLAWRLAPDRSVVVLERETQPGYHSTGRSAAMFMESYGPPGARALTRASRRFYTRPPEGFTENSLLTPRPTMYVAKPGQQGVMDALYDELAATCPGLQRLGPTEVMQHAPCLRADQVLGGLLDADTSDLDVHALHQGFLRGLRMHGGVLRNGQQLTDVRRIGSGSSGCWRLGFQDGSALQAGTVVNATGAWGDEFAARFDVAPVGLQPKRRSAFTFRAPEGLDLKNLALVSAVDETYYFKPDAGRLLGSPANADDSFAHDVRPEELDIAMGIHEIEQASHLVVGRPLSTWAGLRSFVPDGELVIGWDDAREGFFWLVGQGGYGIQSAAGASELAAALLLRTALSENLLEQSVQATQMAVLRLR